MSDVVPGKAGLPDLAAGIRREIEAAESDFQSAVQHAIQAGALLIDAKAQVKHGGWLPWLEANFPGSVRSAQGYMRLAENAEDAQRVAHLGLKGALREISAPKPEPKDETAASNRPHPLTAAIAKREAAKAKADAIDPKTYQDHTAAAKAWIDVAEANRDVIRELARQFCVQSTEAEAEGADDLATAYARAGGAGMVWAAHYEPWDPAHGDAIDEWDLALNALEAAARR
jgi:hypothetical protein